jgi:hypothetical protein
LREQFEGAGDDIGGLVRRVGEAGGREEAVGAQRGGAEVEAEAVKGAVGEVVVGAAVVVAASDFHGGAEVAVAGGRVQVGGEGGEGV